ncbi:FAD-dependent oxidoreductase [Egicoccus sp. AB-alg2]|uniref:FAD-dependent oxidoreductase n=1 Tax=Egicoccus sp. AB-alg2 TaxID=3242693 RepID=UPI00359EF371
MARIVVVGDGPGGLSAALFLAKAGHEVTVFGQDQTPMHYAQLHNYLGVPDVAGPDFQRAAREQVAGLGADVVAAEVTDLEGAGDTFIVHTNTRPPTPTDYLVLAGGKSAQPLARRLGLSVTDGRVGVDAEYRTPVDRVYAIGRLVRPDRSQAIISAGAGAVAALDILSREAGTDVHDWDTPPGQD